MEGKGPYRIYDPGGGTQEEAAAAFERLVEENTRLKEKMQGIKSLGELLEESQTEASKLRQKVEDLVKDNEMLRSSSFDKLADITGGDPDPGLSATGPGKAEKVQDKETQKPPSTGSSSEFEIVSGEDKRLSQESRKSDLELANEDTNLMLHLQRLESTLSVFAEEADKNQVLVHLGRMALEFNRLASKVHKNEQRTSILQTLCEQLRNENEDLRAKLEKDLEQRNQATEKLRCENLELRKMVMMSNKVGVKGEGVESAGQQQSGVPAEKASGQGVTGASEKKVKVLEHQRNELLEVNKQWDQHFRSMKQQYEQKITDLRQKLADSQKALNELEKEREQKQRDFDRKLLLAKSKIEVEEALEEALNAQAPAPSTLSNAMELVGSMRPHELLTQNELLKQQVKIFEEDFQRERSDRERMNEEKEELRQQLEKLKKQLTASNNQLRISKDDYQREKEEKEKLKKLLKQHKQASGERLNPEPLPGPLGPAFPVYQFQYSPPGPHHVYRGCEDWQQIRYPPLAMAGEHPPMQNFHPFPPPEYTWRPACAVSRNQNPPAVEGVKPLPKEAEPAGLGLPKHQRPV
ncbi:TNFAIP3-interacting protein 1 isoform X2 [Emydura macquarii macquarii]|uniref:TNFAIP3-interacting protein 1 isoform X2 n=1 Tax=Emydura macquarii macquarii TaxID=1129001 RepID=UPI00352AE221